MYVGLSEVNKGEIVGSKNIEYLGLEIKLNGYFG